jgi:hypothetical protein
MSKDKPTRVHFQVHMSPDLHRALKEAQHQDGDRFLNDTIVKILKAHMIQKGHMNTTGQSIIKYKGTTIIGESLALADDRPELETLIRKATEHTEHTEHTVSVKVSTKGKCFTCLCRINDGCTDLTKGGDYMGPYEPNYSCYRSM